MKSMSTILISIINKKVAEWNKRILNETDLFEIADRTEVYIVEDELLKPKGEYVIYAKQPCIILRKGLKPNLKLWVGMHELGHHLLHYPVTHKFSRGTIRRLDREANFFAAIALIPTYLVKTRTLGEIMEEYSYTKDLLLIRKEIYEAYKI